MNCSQIQQRRGTYLTQDFNIRKDIFNIKDLFIDESVNKEH